MRKLLPHKISPVPLWLRGQASDEVRRRAVEVITQIGVEAIPEEMTFLSWCQAMAAKGLKVDGKPFKLDDRPALIPIYEAIPTTAAEAAGKTLVIMKSTQIGLTIWETMANLYMSLKWEPVTIGMFMPSQSVAIHKSEHRFMRIVRSSPELYKILITGRDVSGNPIKVGEGNVLTRKIKDSLLLFLWTTGRVTTESIPMDVVTLDEVQEMTLDQIDKVRARTGDSAIDFTLLLSTANMPDLDIDHWYRLGTQEIWHTKCPQCGEFSDLSDPNGIFPGRSIGYTDDDYHWTCPQCLGVIDDPQQGMYIQSSQPSLSNIRSFLLPRTISPRMTPRQMVEDWSRAKTGDQKKSFYNRTLARPYIDADQLPVTLALCEACAEEGVREGVVWKKEARETYMGIDQMGGFNCIIISERRPDGRMAVIHVEAIFDIDPFSRSADLMGQYGVSICVVEQLPNVNDARRFANQFPGRVFLANYADLREDMLRWGDEFSKSDRRTSEEDRSRYTVTLNQYKMMQTSLYRVRERFVLFPNPDALIQNVIEGGSTKRIPILRDWVFYHFTKTALVVTQDEHERKARAKVVKIGIDPHMSYAFMLMNAAWARNHGTSMMILPQEDLAADNTIAKDLPGLPDEIVRVVDTDGLTTDTCAGCLSFDKERGWCNERKFLVRGIDPVCGLFLSDSV